MTDNPLDAYAYLWTTEKNEWVLLADEDSRRENDFVPYNIKSWRVLIIADDTLHQEVVKKMKAANMPQVTDEDIFGRK